MDRFPSEQPGARIPMLFWHLGLNLALGAAFGVAFTAFLVATNFAGLRDLIAGSNSALLALGMLCFMNMLTFGSLAMGTSIMSLPREAEPRQVRDDKIDHP
jgi:hypothetical protein